MSTTPVTPATIAAPRPNLLTSYVKKVTAISEMEVQKLMHDQWDIVTRSVQPVLWLLLFGGVFGRLRVLPPELGSYLDFVAPGILAQSVMTISIFQGITQRESMPMWFGTMSAAIRMPRSPARRLRSWNAASPPSSSAIR